MNKNRSSSKSNRDFATVCALLTLCIPVALATLHSDRIQSKKNSVSPSRLNDGMLTVIWAGLQQRVQSDGGAYNILLPKPLLAKATVVHLTNQQHRKHTSPTIASLIEHSHFRYISWRKRNPDDETDRKCVDLIHGSASARAEIKKHGPDLLCAAASKGMYRTARILLRKGVRANSEDSFGRTPLSYCLDYKTTRILIKYGADPNLRPSIRTMPVKNMVLHGADLSALRLLIRAGADPDAKGDDYTPLMFVVDVETAKILISAGAKIDAVNRSGYKAWNYVYRDVEGKERVPLLKLLRAPHSVISSKAASQ